MHHLIPKTPNYKPTVVEQTIQIYAGITDYPMSVLFPLLIVFVKSRQELVKSNITSSRIKPLNYCLQRSLIMTEYELEKIIHESKELMDIRDEYQKTYQLLQEKRWDELRNHIDSIAIKHPSEAILHNITHIYRATTLEENAVNCMSFLENLFKEKLGLDVVDITKYILKK